MAAFVLGKLAHLSIDYAKKKDKRAAIKAQKDEAVRGEATYKSSTIHVGSGEPASSGTYFSDSLYHAKGSVVAHAAQKPQEEEGTKSRPSGHGCKSPSS